MPERRTGGSAGVAWLSAKRGCRRRVRMRAITREQGVLAHSKLNNRGSNSGGDDMR